MTASSHQPIETELTPALDEAELAQVWRRVREAQAERRVAPRRWRYGLAAGAALAIATVALLWAWPHPQTPVGALGGDVALTPGMQLDAEAPRAIAMTDGSRVELTAHTRLEVLANEGDKFVTAVRRGKVAFDVRPGGPRRWIIETDLATVEVVGTAFAVERSASALAVEVERGVVLVRGERVPGRVVRLTAGQRIDVAAPTTAAVEPPIAIAPIATAPIAPAPIAPAPIATAPAPTAPAPTAIATAPASDPRAAPTAPPSLATPPAVDAPAVPDPTIASGAGPTPPAPIDIIARADELVAQGQPARAADELTTYLRTAPGDATAGLAAFLLGRLAQDQLAQPTRAADAYARVLAIGSPRAIQEDALARRARALEAAGRTADARATARAYLDRYPTGPRRAAMTLLAGP